MPTTSVEVIELDRECVEMKHMNATLSDQYTDLGAKLVEARVAGSTMRGQLGTEERQITAPKTQSADAQLALKRPSGETSQTVADLQALAVAVEASLRAEKARVERPEGKCAAGAKKRQQFLAKGQETIQGASRHLADGEESLQGLQSKIATATVEIMNGAN